MRVHAQRVQHAHTPAQGVPANTSGTGTGGATHAATAFAPTGSMYAGVWRALGLRRAQAMPAPETPYVMDMSTHGNVGRYIRTVDTPAEANLLRRAVFVDTQDPHLPRLALFAKRKLYPGEELLYCRPAGSKRTQRYKG